MGDKRKESEKEVSINDCGIVFALYSFSKLVIMTLGFTVCASLGLFTLKKLYSIQYAFPGFSFKVGVHIKIILTIGAWLLTFLPFTHSLFGWLGSVIHFLLLVPYSV